MSYPTSANGIVLWNSEGVYCRQLYLNFMGCEFKNNDGKFMWQKQLQLVKAWSWWPVNRDAMKIWRRSRRFYWMKYIPIYNLRNVYQTKDIQPWSEGKVNGYVPLNIIIENFTAFYWDGIVHKFLVFLLYTAHPIYFIQLAADGTWLGSKDTNKPILCWSQV